MEAYPSSLSSRATADNVNEFYEVPRFQSEILQGFASSSVMTARNDNGNSKDENSRSGESANRNHDICPNTHSIICCWGRDRQSNDDNGNCKANDCDNAQPADNSNL